MFRGRHEHTIDAKGRTSLPARFRELLAASGENRIVLARGFDACVVAYPMQAWLQFEQRLLDLPALDEHVEQARRHCIGSAEECDLDKLGRLVVPAHLRDWAQLNDEVTWVGNIQFVELWDRAARNEIDAPLRDPAARVALKRALVQQGFR